MNAYQILCEELRSVADVRYATAVLQWDQETYMPAKGAAMRARQIATLSEYAHQRFTSDHFLKLLEKAENEVFHHPYSEQEKANIKLIREDLNKQRKLPGAFVKKLSELISSAFQQWTEARKNDDFSIFSPALHEMVELKLEEAEYLGYEEHPYDALLNDYEKGARVAQLDPIFSRLSGPLQEMIKKIGEKQQVDNSFLHQYFPQEQQWQYGLSLLKNLGYDFSAGRQDLAPHPFSINFNAQDVRITTRIDENDLGNMIWSTIHELGHAFYEQGMLEDQYGLPLGEAASLSIHESQSRFWENNIGRSKEFWHHQLPQLQTWFPQQLGTIGLEEFYRGINQVKPSLIRTEADELTYHFHVIIRYEIEKQLFSKHLKTEEIPEFWKEQYREKIGVIVPNNKDGCLQDVHWSHGSFGYFPTYSLGSLYAAQLLHQIQRLNPSWEEEIKKGDYSSTLQWLRENIHTKGRKYTSEELCVQITGEPLNIQYFLDYAQKKYGEIYEID